MRRFTVTARGLSSVEVEGQNWVVALGLGLAELGREDLSRLACEVLPNGTVIARDIASGTGYVVQSLEEETGDEDTQPLDAEVEAALPDLFALSDEDDETVEEDAPDEGVGGLEELAELPMDALQPLDAEDDLRRRIGEAETVLMASQLTLEAAFATIPAESGAVILEERGHMRFTAVRGPHSRKLMGVRLPMGTGVAGFALEHGRTIVLGNANDDPRHCAEVDALTGYDTEAIAVVPIRVQDQVYGALELLNLPPGERFTEERVAAMEAVADSLAERLHEDAARTTHDPVERRI